RTKVIGIQSHETRRARSQAARSIPELLSHRRRLEQLQKEVPVGSISDIEGRVVRADYPTSSDNPENSDSRPHAIHDHLPGRDLLVAFQRLRADRFIRYVIVR